MYFGLYTQSFVYGNNLYYQASVTSESEQVTSSGQQPIIFNGIPDWVYEGEEIRKIFN